MNHTPGPWIVHPPQPYGDAGYQVLAELNDGGGFDTIVGEVNCEKRRAHLSKANARLIAAAPELLAACMEAVEAIQAEKVLQASRGESVAVELGILQQKLMVLISRAEGKGVA